MRLESVAFVGIASILVPACGSGPMGASASELSTYRQLAHDVGTTAGGYQTTMMGTMLADCQSVHDQYDAQVRPWVTQMMQLSGDMDDLMAAHGGMMDADMGCVATTMTDELNRHHAAACSSQMMSENQAEVVRHTEAMASYADHAMTRSQQMMSGFDTGTWSFGPMMAGCGTGPMWDGGMMRDGGMMWDGGMMRDGGMMGGRAM